MVNENFLSTLKQHHSRLRAEWKSTKGLAASKATRAFVHDHSLLHHLVCRAITCIGNVDLQHPEDHPSAWSSFQLTSWMRNSSVLSQEQSTQNGRLCVHIVRIVIITINLHCRKIFVSLIFTVSWTNANAITVNFSPIYGKWMSKFQDF